MNSLSGSNPFKGNMREAKEVDYKAKYGWKDSSALIKNSVIGFGFGVSWDKLGKTSISEKPTYEELIEKGFWYTSGTKQEATDFIKASLTAAFRKNWKVVTKSPQGHKSLKKFFIIPK